MLTDLAVLLADGGQTITDLAVLRHQPGLFGPVASTATAWRVLNSVDDTVLAGLKRARARARERAWLLRGEAGRPVPTVRCGGVEVPGLVIDFDASLVTCHSEKEQAASTFKKGYGYHPLLVWLDNTSEALAGMLRPGNSEWQVTRLVHGVLAKVEIKQLRYQLLHTAARIVRGQRKVRIRIDTSWPWAGELAAAFTRLAAIRQPLII